MTEQHEGAPPSVEVQVDRLTRGLEDAAMDYARGVVRAAREPLGNLVVITREEFWTLVEMRNEVSRLAHTRSGVRGHLSSGLMERFLAIRPTTLDGATPPSRPLSGVCIQGPQIILDGEATDMNAEDAERIRGLIQETVTIPANLQRADAGARMVNQPTREEAGRRVARARWDSSRPTPAQEREEYVRSLTVARCDRCGNEAELCTDDDDTFRYCRDCHPENPEQCEGCNFCRCSDCQEGTTDGQDMDTDS